MSNKATPHPPPAASGPDAPAVHVTRRRFSSLIAPTGDARADRLISRTVPGAFRDKDRVTGDVIVYSSHVDRLLDALRRAGYQVHEVTA